MFRRVSAYFGVFRRVSPHFAMFRCVSPYFGCLHGPQLPRRYDPIRCFAIHAAPTRGIRYVCPARGSPPPPIRGLEVSHHALPLTLETIQFGIHRLAIANTSAAKNRAPEIILSLSIINKITDCLLIITSVYLFLSTLSRHLVMSAK